MITLLSPAKTLDFETPASSSLATQPSMLDQAEPLIQQLRTLSPQDVSSLMSLSDKLGVLNYDRFQQWSLPFTPENAKQAALAFQGDVYQGLEADTFNKNDWHFAQDHLRILSGLYGILKPLDLIQPYRLEMGTKLENERGKNLYAYWGSLLSNYLNEALDKHEQPHIVNLASNEYFKAVDKKSLVAPVITPVFKDWKNGQYKIISFYAKKARGLMAAWIMKEKVDQPEGLKDFNEAGYQLSSELSQPSQPVFTRKIED